MMWKFTKTICYCIRMSCTTWQPQFSIKLGLGPLHYTVGWRTDSFWTGCSKGLIKNVMDEDVAQNYKKGPEECTPSHDTVHDELSIWSDASFVIWSVSWVIFLEHSLYLPNSLPSDLPFEVWSFQSPRSSMSLSTSKTASLTALVDCAAHTTTAVLCDPHEDIRVASFDFKRTILWSAWADNASKEWSEVSTAFWCSQSKP